ncbi:MAG: aminotransferase class I/II-fold pyridoxal phosphate-dependent enzyme [Devosia nanyangense]|nr:aminotransferase class I/II-fold pyridoxal phosphate-dependent enzyme [Devosia nanyangense]
MNDLEAQLKAADAAGARFKLIVTDGVFSMDGYVAKLPEICTLAEKYGALVMIDDCHATGHLGEKGRGTPALTGVGNRVDIVSGEGHVIGMKSRASRGGRFHLDPETKGIGVNLPGAFAEFVRIPAFNIVPLPDTISDELGAILDPLGNAVHTALAFDLVGEDVLITGAGPIGIMGAAIARQVGARHVVITDVDAKRLELAARTTDVVPVNVAQEKLEDVMARLGMREGFDVGLEMSGSPQALDQMLDHLVMGGKVALLGLPAKPFLFDLSKVVLRMITLKGIYGREMFETWHKMLAMLESGLDVSGVITDRFNVDDYKVAFEKAAAGGSGKIVLEWV